MRFLTYISFFLFAFLLQSCEEEITIDYVEVEKLVVVNSTFCPLKEFEIQLNFSRNVDDKADKGGVIEDADIRIYNDAGDFLLAFNHVGSGKYLTPDHTIPIENQTYHLEVKVEGYPLITAESRIPTQAILENVRTTEIEQDGETIVKVDFDIKDAEDEDNYYIWEILSGNPFESEVVEVPFYQQSNGPSDSALSNGEWSKLFAAEMDMVQEISFSSFLAESEGSSDSTNVEDEAYIRLISASSDYYEYLLSIELNSNNNSSSSSTIVPVSVHSNIDGGHGIFAGFNQQAEKLPSL